MLKLRRALGPVSVALSYLLLACLVYWPVSPWSGHTIIDCACEDPVQELWFLHWTAWAPLHGHNPFLTSYLHAPYGANLALNTSFPLLGALAAPITLTAGPLVSYNLLLRLALGLSAGSMYWVLRRYTSWWPAAYLGGLLYGFSAYEMGHAHRHLFLTFIPLLPLFIPAVDDWLVRMRRPPVRCGLLLGLLIAGEFLISPEVLVFIVGTVVIALALLAVRYREQVRARVRPLLIGIGAALAPLLVFAAYPGYLLLRGPNRPVGALHPLVGLYRFHGDLLAPVLPTKGEWLFTTRSGERIVAGSVEENGFYLGILLILVLALAWRWRRLPLVWVSTAIALIAFVLSLGQNLVVDNHTVLHWMPFRLIDRIPIIQQMEPARLSLPIMLAAAIVLGVGLDRWRNDGWRRSAASRPVTWRRSVAVLVVAVVCLVPLIPRIPMRTARVSVPAFFTSHDVDVIAQGSLALTYPYSRTPVDVPMLWQSAAHLRFRIFGGMAFVPGLDRTSTWTPLPPSPPNIDDLLLTGERGYPTLPSHVPGLAGRVADFLRQYRVNVILVDPTWPRASDVLDVVEQALGGAQPRLIGDMDVWLDVSSLIPSAG